MSEPQTTEPSGFVVEMSPEKLKIKNFRERKKNNA